VQEISFLTFVKHLSYHTTSTDETVTIILRLPVAEILSETMTDI